MVKVKVPVDSSKTLEEETLDRKMIRELILKMKDLMREIISIQENQEHIKDAVQALVWCPPTNDNSFGSDFEDYYSDGEDIEFD